MQTETYISVEGDSVDLIAFRRFVTHGMETKIFEANPGLADLGPIIPAGTTVVIPVPVVADRVLDDQLWN